MTPAIRILVRSFRHVGGTRPPPRPNPLASHRPIRMIVPFRLADRGTSVARLIGRRLSEDWGQPVVVENRPGGNTIIGRPGRGEGCDPMATRCSWQSIRRW